MWLCCVLRLMLSVGFQVPIFFFFLWAMFLVLVAEGVDKVLRIVEFGLVSHDGS
jgi:hypothetical protein